MIEAIDPVPVCIFHFLLSDNCSIIYKGVIGAPPERGLAESWLRSPTEYAVWQYLPLSATTLPKLNGQNQIVLMKGLWRHNISV